MFYIFCFTGILIINLFYIIKISEMAQTEIKELNKQLPEPSRKLIEIAREIFGDEIPAFFSEKWKEEGLRKGRKEGRQEGIKEGIKEGRTETIRDFFIKTMQKFPNWTDAEVADFVGVTVETVQQLRLELEKAK